MQWQAQRFREERESLVYSPSLCFLVSSFLHRLHTKSTMCGGGRLASAGKNTLPQIGRAGSVHEHGAQTRLQRAKHCARAEGDRGSPKIVKNHNTQWGDWFIKQALAAKLAMGERCCRVRANGEPLDIPLQ